MRSVGNDASRASAADEPPDGPSEGGTSDDGGWEEGQSPRESGAEPSGQVGGLVMVWLVLGPPPAEESPPLLATIRPTTRPMSASTAVPPPISAFHGRGGG